MRVGTRVFVDEGTAPGVRGPRTFPFFAIVSSHLSNFSRCWFQTNTTAQAACGSTRGMDRAGIGVFSAVTGACRELQIYYFLPLIVAHRVNIICGDSAASILREETGIRLRRQFASLEMG